MDRIQNEKSYGTLIVQARSAGGAIPIEGATVIVRMAHENEENSLIRVTATNENGATEPIEIETPSPAESLSPGGKKPYSEITTEVTLAGYYTAVNTGIPVYPGITSIQPVTMIPLPMPSPAMPFPPDSITVNENDASPEL